MMFAKQTADEKRRKLSSDLSSGKLLRFPGAFSPLVSMLVEKIGFDGVYISGAVISSDLGLPDIGLTTMNEVALRGHAIARTTDLPAIIDIDTGFGEVVNVARTIQELEKLGLCGAHLEDQQLPKRCGHLDKKNLVSVSDMKRKVRAACDSRVFSDFLIIARTDARPEEGLEKAIGRAKAYEDAGADMIFPEALADEHEFEKFRKSVSVPLLANMTEFGKSKLLTSEQLRQLGYNLVIYPVTAFRLAMKAVEDGLVGIFEKGTQEHLLDKMQTRKRLYELIRYEEYNRFDNDIFNFDVS